MSVSRVCRRDAMLSFGNFKMSSKFVALIIALLLNVTKIRTSFNIYKRKKNYLYTLFCARNNFIK